MHGFQTNLTMNGWLQPPAARATVCELCGKPFSELAASLAGFG